MANISKKVGIKYLFMIHLGKILTVRKLLSTYRKNINRMNKYFFKNDETVKIQIVSENYALLLWFVCIF